MKMVNDGIDFLIFSNKNLKDKFSSNTNLKIALELYLTELDEFLATIDTNPNNCQRLMDFFKKKYLIQRIPDSYMRYSKGYIKELGYYKENYRDYRTNLNEEQYTIVLKCIQDEQMNSLLPWIEFLCNKEREYPIWFRYYIFNKITKIGTAYLILKKFSKRSNSTTDPYIECNYNILDKIYELLNKVICNNDLNEKEKYVFENGLKFSDMFFLFENTKRIKRDEEINMNYIII